MARATRTQTEREVSEILKDFQALLTRIKFSNIPVMKGLASELQQAFLHAYVSTDVDPPFTPCGADEADMATVLRDYTAAMGGFNIKPIGTVAKECRERLSRTRRTTG